MLPMNSVKPDVARWWQALISWGQKQQPLISLLLLFVTMRMLGVLFLRPGGFFIFHLADTGHYWNLARWQAANAYPFFDYWMEYPPIFPWLTVLAYRISLVLPPWQGSAIWFSLAYHVLLIPFELGGFLLIYALANMFSGRQRAYESIAKYALVFVPFIVFLGFFDTLPMFLLLLGLYALLQNWPGRTGLAIGLGIMTKVIPVILVPAAWSYLGRGQARARLLLAMAAVILAISLPALLVNPEMSLASLRSMLSRVSYQTVWAILEGYHSYGVVSYERFDPSAATWQNHTSILPAGLITLGFAALFLLLYVAWQRTKPHNPRRLIAFVGLTLTWLMLWSRGFSPQWMVFQVPFVILLLPGWFGLACLITLDVVTMFEWGLGYSMMLPYTWYIDGEVILHTILILALGVEYARIALNMGRGWRQSLRWAPKALVIVVLIGQFALLVRAGTVYARDHALKEPHAALVESIRQTAAPDAGILLPQIAIYERLFPLLNELDIYWVAKQGVAADSWQSPQFARFVEKHADLWFVNDLAEPDRDRGTTMSNWLSQHFGRESVQWIGSAQVTRFVTDCPVDVTLRQELIGGEIQLVAASASGSGGHLCVRLDWQSGSRLTEDYVVFVHLLDEEGKLVAQNDQQPVAGLSPTSQWSVANTISDLHGVILPEPLPNGLYQIHVGMYGPDLARLPILDDAGNRLGTTVYLAELSVTESGWDLRMVP